MAEEATRWPFVGDYAEEIVARFKAMKAKYLIVRVDDIDRFVVAWRVLRHRAYPGKTFQGWIRQLESYHHPAEYSVEVLAKKTDRSQKLKLIGMATRKGDGWEWTWGD